MTMKDLFKLLIVDDELILRNGFKYLCDWNSYGFNIVGEAASGEEALVLIEELNPHIVIVDIVMPLMNGIDFTKVVQERYPHIKVIILSSFSEFDYVREAFKYGAVDYLLKPQLKSEQLINLLTKISTELREHDLSQRLPFNPSQLLKSILIDKNNSHGDLEELSSYMDQSIFILIKSSLQNIPQQEKENVKDKLSKIVEAHLNRYQYIEVCSDREYYLLVNISPTVEDDLYASLSILNDALNKELNSIKFIVSSTFKTVQELEKINEQLTSKIGRLFYFWNESVVFEKTVKINDGIQGEFEFDMSQLIKLIKGFHMDEAKKYIEYYFENIKFRRLYDEYDFKRLVQNIIYNIINTSSTLGFDVSHINRGKIKLFKEIDQCHDVNNILNKINVLLNEISDLMNQQIERKNSIILEKVIQYVEEHYNEDITLSDIADKLHINYYYLSTYFKNQTSENLTTYINRIKIEKAQKLLRDSQDTIAEISKIVGFSDHNYFSKVFKKHVGMTPSMYRRKELGWFKK